ncbi:glycosyltransferase 87 family protein [Kitasatospora sp. NPDC006697]|uniref:glycosyltransferase 87 family protein n=1 Tax=Kitasatospora sp. NPDC006697 TaxID=3364020 RepID=UPI0036C03F3D
MVTHRQPDAPTRGRPLAPEVPRQRTGGPPLGPAARPEPAGRVAALGGRRAVRLLACLVAAGWAGCFPLVSRLANQRFWGETAAPAYLLAGLAVLVLPRRLAGRAAALLTLGGAVLLPLTLLAVHSRAQSEVGVVERSAALLLHTGTPYLPHPAAVTDFDPYLPGMALFGLPRALLGRGSRAALLAGDARLWFAAAFLACLAVSWRLVRTDPADSPLLPLAVLTGSPLIALSLAVGGVDLPLIGVCCLALALAADNRPIAAGLVLALACTLKWTAWPALPVAVLLLRRRHGSRAALRAAAVCAALSAAVILPFALQRPRDLWLQVVRYPLGLTAVRTPAGSPLPGKLLADLGPAGHTAALALMLAGGLAVGGWLLLRPPATAAAAADRLAAGLTTAFLLAPAGRFGYLALPAVLVCWPRLAQRAAAHRSGARVRWTAGASRSPAGGV